MQEHTGQPEIAQRRRKVWLALMLAWVAGFVDLFGYLLLVKIFTSHMSGNSVAMMANIVQNHWKEAIRHAFPIPAFVLGVFIAAALSEIALRKKFRRRLSVGMVLEMLLIVLFAFYYRQLSREGSHSVWHLWVASGFLAMAMGVQNAAFRQVWGKPVHTTFVTGVLTHLAENAAELLFNKGNPARNRKSLFFFLLNCGLWFSFALGGLCGGVAELRLGLPTLAAPVCVLAFIVICDLRSPVQHGTDKGP